MYTLKLVAKNGEIITLNFETYEEALRMKTAFMLMGQYSDVFIEGLKNV